MNRLPRTFGIAAALLMLAAGVAAIWLQERAIERLWSHRKTTAAAWAAAQARVRQLDRQAAAPPGHRDDAQAREKRMQAIRTLQLRVGAERARGAIHAAYGPLLLKLGLDRATAGRLETLLGEERLTARDALAAAKAQGPESIQELKSAVDEALTRDDLQIQALLGPDGYPVFSAYRQTLPEQETVAQITGRLAASPTPLGEGQQAQLTQLIDGMEPPFYQETQALLSEVGMPAAPLTREMVDAAASFLSGPQQDALRQMQAEWAEQTVLKVLMHPKSS